MAVPTLSNDILDSVPGDIVIYDPSDVPGLDVRTAIPHVIICISPCDVLLEPAGRLITQAPRVLARSADWITITC